MKALPFLMALAAAVAFAAGVNTGHISMDDWGYIYGCPFVKDGLTFSNILSSFTNFGYDAFWMPLTFITYMADISLLGGGWVVHHAVNLFLHAANAAIATILLSKLFERFFPDVSSRVKTLSISAAVLFWALHPMRAESIVYIAARKDLLWSLFAMLSLIMWIEALKVPSRLKYFLSFLFCALSCISKPTAVCIPFVAFAIDWALSRRFPKKVVRYAPMLAVSVLVGFITLYCQSNPMDYEKLDVFGEPLWWRVLNAVVSLGMYAWHVIWPFSIRFDYRAVFGGWPVDGAFGLVFFSLLFAGLLYSSFKASSRARSVILLSLSWVIFSLGPVLGVLGTVNGDHAYADRYTYFPSLAVSLFIAVSLGWLLTKNKRGKYAVASLFVATALFLPLTISVVRSYRNDFTAFSRTLEKDPDHWRALRVVGMEYCAKLGRIDEGVSMLNRSLSLRPSQKTAERLAYILSLRGKEGDYALVRSLAAPIARNPRLDRSGFMLEALGITALCEGDDALAVRYLSAAIDVPERAHRDFHARLYLGYALANRGEKEKALKVLDFLRNTTGGDVRFKAAAASRLIRGGILVRLTPQKALGVHEITEKTNEQN